jgi:hypothetical protein
MEKTGLNPLFFCLSQVEISFSGPLGLNLCLELFWKRLEHSPMGIVLLDTLGQIVLSRRIVCTPIPTDPNSIHPSER